MSAYEDMVSRGQQLDRERRQSGNYGLGEASHAIPHPAKPFAAGPIPLALIPCSTPSCRRSQHAAHRVWVGMTPLPSAAYLAVLARQAAYRAEQEAARHAAAAAKLKLAAVPAPKPALVPEPATVAAA